ncbi:V-type ATP synthase subunit E family protein [Labilibacter marinus]|uniref:V-type ATP synthase subunit E family protein n=1 Tax=Labilibacter marinus TaxID=1477105 RepID=UPI000836F6FD|nr:V-type ATP synthase subunit E family protein [Labilibacter marinus]
MQSKLQELTDKLYSDGIQKANEEADSIITKAKQEAERIVEEAQKKAADKVEEAEKQAAETKRNVEAEIKLASQQAISSLRQKIGNSITVAVSEPTLKEVFSDKDYVQSLISKLVEGWGKTGNFDINVVLPESEKAELDKKIEKSFAAEINKGLSFEFDAAVKAGFKVGPSDGSYVISFTEGDFQNFFKSFLRPKTNQLLFEA